MTGNDTPTPAESRFRISVAALVGHLRVDRLGTGPSAELRRMDPTNIAAAPPILHRLLARHVPQAHYGGEAEQKWALIVHLLALAGPLLSGETKSLGEALFAAQYSEGRLTTLLQTPAAKFPEALPRVVRFLVAKQVAPKPYELARLVLSDRSDTQRLMIARKFYQAEAKAKSKQKEAEQAAS